MGDLRKGRSVEEAKRELQEMYVGVPDESVNLSFNHLLVATAKEEEQPIQDVVEVAQTQQPPRTAVENGGVVMKKSKSCKSSFRPGTPHSNRCTLCRTYIYFFRHRCLVCGRVYCRACMRIGMGEMSQGRKCVSCLGRRFHPRYIQIAGQLGFCCMGYPSTVKQQELKWAEIGPSMAQID
ncbi:unnamed protein product [Cuscuta epithymum]|uniref:FYVE-type domain-containing protein n=2 Tax=Cuscuta epithymum TaxID=186058 RepID=A0AAV0F1P9_9ASTE|nr:unnamed protein product [Cuscuta epithymum]